MSVGGTRAAYAPRPVITRRAPTSAPVPLASPWPLMARTVKMLMNVTTIPAVRNVQTFMALTSVIAELATT